MDFDHIIIQAGGKGTRLEHFTTNKPKALVPIDNSPIIFHVFKRFPNKRFIIVGDYKFTVLESYLKTFANVPYILIRANHTGTCGGICDALDFIPENTPFMLIWSDLLLSDDFTTQHLENDKNYIGISKGVKCRWSYKDSTFIETPSADQGVAGLFVFKNKIEIHDVPIQGEFVKWLQTKSIFFSELDLVGLREIGTMKAYKDAEDKQYRCRSFNQLNFEGNMVIKTPINSKGQSLSDRECRWYQKVTELGFVKIPRIVS